MSDDDWFEREQLHMAAADGDLARVEALLAEGRDVNAFDADLSRTPLHFAATDEHLDVVDALLAAGADVDARESERIGDTPLAAVAASGSYALAKRLVDAGANPTITGWMGLSALDRAAKRKKGDGPRVYELLRTAAKRPPR